MATLKQAIAKSRTPKGSQTRGHAKDTASPLAASNLVQNPLLSGNFRQPKFTDFAGGQSAKNNRAAEQFQDRTKKPTGKSWA